MKDVVICEPWRTPIRRFGGVLKTVPPAEPATTVVRAIMERTGIDGALVDDVILGQGYSTADGPSIARIAALDAGLAVTVGCGQGPAAMFATP